MGRNLDDIIKSLPVERQARIADIARKNVEEMIAHATALSDFRKAVGKTQAEVGKILGINQNAVSQLESRSDTYVSTLRRFLASLELTLELSVIDKNGVRIELPNFLHAEAAPAANNDDTPAIEKRSTVRAPTSEPGRIARTAKVAGTARTQRTNTSPRKRQA